MQTFAYRILSRPVVLCQGSVDDDDEGSAFAIGRSEVATANDGNTLSLEVVAYHLRYPCQIQPCSLGRHIAFGSEGAAKLHVSCWQQGGHSDRLHSRQLLQLGAQRQVERVNGSLGRVLLARKAISGSQRVIGVEAQVNRSHLLKAP